VVSPDAVQLDIQKLVDACTPTHRAADCDPPRYPTATGCDDAGQVWCLWVRYHEQPTRAVTPLGGTTARCGCGGTGSAGCGCGCGGSQKAGTPAASGTSRSTTCGCTPVTTTPRTPADCQPSRVVEYLEFGVAPRDASCDSLDSALAGTFPMKVVECIRALQPKLTTGLTKGMQRSAASLATGGQVGLNSVGREAVCQLYANVVNLYQADPLRTQCVLPEELQTIDCSPRGPNETEDQFRARLALVLQQLLMLVVLYLRDCVCASLLPPCPGDVCDDRIVLACVTLKQGRVVDICNLSCRRYAGSFVNRDYWLPIGPLLSLLAAKLCCFPLAVPKRDVAVPGDVAAGHSFTTLRRGVPLSRYANLLSAVRSDDFALPRLWRARVSDLIAQVREQNPLLRVEKSLDETPGTIRLAGFLHGDASKAAAKLQAEGVKVEVVDVGDTGVQPAFDAIPRARSGGSATLYTRGGLVVGVQGSEKVQWRPGGGR